MPMLSRRDLFTAAATATGLAMLPASARAQSTGRGYTLLVEDGIDAISVRTLVAGRLGEPATMGRIARDVVRHPEELRAVASRMAGERTIIVACPTVGASVEAAVRRSATRDVGGARELRRVLPASRLEVFVFA